MPDDTGRSDANPAQRPRTPMPRRWDVDHIDGDAAFSAIVALLVLSIFVVTPLEGVGSVSSALLAGIRFAIASLIFLIVAKRRISRLVILATFVATMLPFGGRSPLPNQDLTSSVLTLVFNVAVALIVTASTFRPGFVSTRRVLGGVIVYLCIALAFAHLYAIANLLMPGTFARPGGPHGATFADLLDYSVASLTSIGEAPVIATNPLVHSASRLETVIGQLFPATLLARLVSLSASGPASGAPEDR